MDFINGTGRFLQNVATLGLTETTKIAESFFGRTITNLQMNSTTTSILVITASFAAFGLLRSYNRVQLNPPKEQQLKAINDDMILPRDASKVFAGARLTDDSALEIFQRLDLKSLGKMQCVSKLCNRIASNKYLAKLSIINNFSFSANHWNMIFGNGKVSEKEIDLAFKSLPKNIDEILKSPCVKFPKKAKIDTHMLFYIPSSIEDKPVTLRAVGDLFKTISEFSKNLSGFRSIHQDILEECGDVVIEPGWYLMLKEIVEGDDEEDYDDLVDHINDFNERHGTDYRAPKIGEAIIGTYTEYFKSKNRLFAEKPEAFTWCEENVKGSQVMAGGFGPSGVVILAPAIEVKEDGLGIAPLMKLS